jgi:hypothetical protein
VRVGQAGEAAHAHAHLQVALHFAYHNFVRIHSTLKTTPAVAAGIADHDWSLSELIGLLEAVEDAKPRERGPYKKRAA